MSKIYELLDEDTLKAVELIQCHDALTRRLNAIEQEIATFANRHYEISAATTPALRVYVADKLLEAMTKESYNESKTP